MHYAIVQITRFLFHPITLYVVAWILALSIGVGRWINARHGFDYARPDGNYGHTTIDFGGQWMMGRMLTTGHGKELYHRHIQREVAHVAYTREYNMGEEGIKDADSLMGSFMGTDEKGVGGPLYPPVQALVMAPFALGDYPQTAYFIVQVVMIGFCFLGGLGVSLMSRGRIWWPLASALILAFPGCKGGIDLGQNSSMTLMILIWGWAMTVRGYPVLGGIIWGLLAYKPVWALSFLLALILLRQWRATVSMCLTGLTIVRVTLEFVGTHSWFHWLTIGQEAAALYNIDGNWIPLSRDLLGIPRRMFLDFNAPQLERDNVLARAMSVALWMFVFEVTIRVFFARRDKQISLIGPVPALVFFAAWGCTYHFMYYDSLIALFGILVLLADPRPFLKRTRLEIDNAITETTTRKSNLGIYLNSFVLTMLGLILLYENVARQMRLEATAVARIRVSTRTLSETSTELAPRLHVGAGDYYAWETGAVLILWLWCAGLVLMRRDGVESPKSDSPVVTTLHDPE